MEIMILPPRPAVTSRALLREQTILHLVYANNIRIQQLQYITTQRTKLWFRYGRYFLRRGDEIMLKVNHYHLQNARFSSDIS